jgi:PmbA protein
VDIERIASSLNGYDVEVSSSELVLDSFHFEGKKSRHPQSSRTESLTIRVTKNMKSGSCTTTNPDDWKSCLGTARKICNLSKKEEYYGVPEKSRLRRVRISDRNIESLSLEDLKQAVVDILKRPSVRVVDANFARGTGTGSFANSNGIFFSSRMSSLASSIFVKKGDSVGYESHFSRKVEDFGWIAERASELCMKSIGKKRTKTGIYSVFMDYFAVADIFSVLTNSFYSTNVQKNNSKLRDKLGERLFSSKLTITDDGLLPYGFLSREADGEGTPTKRNVLVKRGVVKGFLYDHTTARKEGKESTGNFFSILRRPSVSESNFIVKPGKRKTNEILSDFEGIYVNSLVGTHTTNPVSGDFSVNTENAFLVKNGRMTPLKQVMVAGNIFDLLKRIAEIGSESRQESSIMCPPIVFSKVQIIA